jgi:hypothetical protein
MSDSLLPTPGDRRRFVESLWDLHSEIAEEVVKPEIDAGKLMRLTALGVNHCMVVLATLLVDEDEQASHDDPNQLQLFAEDELTRCERDPTSGKDSD